MMHRFFLWWNYHAGKRQAKRDRKSAQLTRAFREGRGW